MNTAERPRFRNDLVAHPFNEGGQLFVEVTDPDSGQTYKFYEIEYAIASAMDGRRDVGGLVSWAAEELGVQTSAAELETVITTLGDLGYLTDGTLATARGAQAIVPAPSPAELELGHAGASELPRAASAVEPAPDIDLGLAGGAPVAAPPPAPPMSLDVELGHAGASELAASAPPPPAVDVELGLAGVASPLPTVIEAEPPPPEESFAGLMDESPVSARKPVSDFDVPPTPPPAEVPVPNMSPRASSHFEDDDGPTNLPSPMPDIEEEDVSVDLSEHLSIGAEDVKEAVRASKVMKAVDIPADLMAELEADAAPAPEPAPVELPAHPAPVELPAQPPDKPISGRVKLREPRPEPRPPLDEPVPLPEVKKRGTSPILVVLLLLVMVGGAAAYYFLVYKKDDTNEVKPPGEKKNVNKGAGDVKGAGTDGTNAVKKEPPPPATTLTAGEPVTEDVVAMQAGPVVWSVESGSAVAVEDQIAEMPYDRKLEEKIRNAAHDKKRYDKRIADWTAQKENASEAVAKQLDRKIERETKKIADRQATIDAAQAVIDGSKIKAPVAGTIELVAANNERVKEGQTIATIAGAAPVVGVFDIPAGKTFEPGAAVKVAKKADASKIAECTVTEFGDAKLSIECAADSGVLAGDEVILQK